jgi:toxin ParE1/3/4
VKDVVSHREADAEFTRATEYYAQISPELGQHFYRHVKELLAEISDQPAIHRVFDPPARRLFRRPFPYAIVYLDRADYVWVVAVMHFKQHPNYWKHRLTN